MPGPSARPSNRRSNATSSINFSEEPLPSNFDTCIDEDPSPKTPSSYGFPEEPLNEGEEDSSTSSDYPADELLSEDEYFRD